jgi:hypothetical protein
MKKKFTVLEKHILTGLLVLGCMMLFETSDAQKINYIYDDSGNRIKRFMTRSLTVDTAFNNGNDSIPDNLKELYDWNDEKKDAFKVLIYPNPTSGILEIELPELKPNQKSHLYLYSRTGILVKQTDRLQKRQSIDISNQSVGLYVLRITIDDKAVIRRIIKSEY